MKFNLILLPVIILLIGCGTSKNAETAANAVPAQDAQTDPVEPITEEEVIDDQPTGQTGLAMANGIVRDQTREGCGFVIEVLMDNTSNESTYLSPLPLPEEYQVDGKTIQFQFRFSRRPSKCTTSTPIVIDEIME